MVDVSSSENIVSEIGLICRCGYLPKSNKRVFFHTTRLTFSLISRVDVRCTEELTNKSSHVTAQIFCEEAIASKNNIQDC